MPWAGITVEVNAATVGAAIAFVGVLIGLRVNGDRAERQRRRELHGRALAAMCDYGEMPFVIRRRRCEPEWRSAERVRISDHFSAVKAEIATCQVLLGADGHRRIADAFSELSSIARSCVGREAHDAWKEEPISSDAEMNMGSVFERIDAFRKELSRFEAELAWATLPRRHRAWRAVRERGPRRREARTS
jgi:hypothetical protein